MIYNYIIFHKGCIDGFTGFFILHNSNSIDPNALIYPDVPYATKPPPNVHDKDVIIIDVAYKNNIILEIIKHARSVVFIDHHDTIKNDVLEIKKTNNLGDKLTVIYDDKLCGASLTWNFVHPNKKLPLFITYVQDNDTGTWKVPDTEYFIAGIEANYNFKLDVENIKKWEKLFVDKHIAKLIKRGKIYYEYINKLIKYNLSGVSLHYFPSEAIYNKYKSVFVKPKQYKVAVYCGSGCPSSTILARNIIRNTNCDFVIMWVYHVDSKKYVLTLRSHTVDVGSIAYAFGGGGHKLASACSILSGSESIICNISDLFFV